MGKKRKWRPSQANVEDRRDRQAPPGSWSRYYEVLDVEGMRLHAAPTGVCVVSIGTSHPGRAGRAVFDKRLHLDFSGKKKKGAMIVKPDTVLCRMITDDGEFAVTPGVRGKLLEVNEPAKVTGGPDAFVAILQVDAGDLDRARRRLKS